MSDLQKLREPFPPDQIGKLPRVWCRACKEAGKGKACQEHRITRCDECGQKGTTGHMHLDYVGHAEVTHRLLDADLEWTWEPMGFDTDGLPAIVKDGKEWSLWIRLTVGGVTKPGVGCVTVESFTTEPLKQLISDALRNASMRFGVALDLWAKSELQHETSSGRGEDPSTPASAGHVVEEGESVPPKPSAPSSTPRAKGRKPSDRGETTSALVEPGDASAEGLGEVAPADASPGKPYLAAPKLEEAREALGKS